MTIKTNQVYYQVLIGLMGLATVNSLFWAGHDVSARLGLWPNAEAAERFVASLGVIQEVAFFSHVVMNIVALALALKKKWYALLAFLLAFVLGRMDWLMLIGNQHWEAAADLSANMGSLPLLVVEGVVIGLLFVLSFDQTLN